MILLRGFRRAALLTVAALLLGCNSRALAPLNDISVLEAVTSSDIPSHTIAPTPTAKPAVTASLEPAPSPTQEPTPTPKPTPSGLCGGRYPDKFTDEPVLTDTSYQSADLAVFLSEVSDKKPFSPITYFVADIYAQDITLIRTAPAGENFTSVLAAPVKQMAQKNNSLLAASGDYYAHSTQSLVIRNGVSYRDKLSTRFESCVLFRDGTLSFYDSKDLDVQALLDAGAWQGWTFGPSLLSEKGQPMTEVSKKYASVSDKNPRCMLGYYEPGHYCLVVVDGRQRSSAGLTLIELSQLAYDLGCTKAYNLDGGQSAQLYWQGQIFNHPVGGGRSISDIIYIAAPDAP